MKSAVLLFAVLLCACSPSKRMQRLLAKHPELSRVDTLHISDTVYLPGDTVLLPVVLRGTDTVTVETERQVVRVVRIPTGSPCDTVALRAEVLAMVKADTVVHTITMEVDRVVPCPTHALVRAWWRTAAIVLFLLLLSLLLVQRVAK